MEACAYDRTPHITKTVHTSAILLIFEAEFTECVLYILSYSESNIFPPNGVEEGGSPPQLYKVFGNNSMEELLLFCTRLFRLKALSKNCCFTRYRVLKLCFADIPFQSFL